MATPKKITPTKAPAEANDHLELRAAEIADREGKPRVSDDQRKKAFQELSSTAPATDKASH